MEFYYYMDYTRARELASGALAAYARLEAEAEARRTLGSESRRDLALRPDLGFRLL